MVVLPAIQNKFSTFLHLECQEKYLVHSLFEDDQVIPLELLLKVIIQWMYVGSDGPDISPTPLEFADLRARTP